MSGSRTRGRNSRIKGPIFPSMRNQQVSTPTRHWLAHNSTRAQLRHLRQKCRALLDSKDPEVIAIGARVIAAVRDEPDPVFGALHLYSAGMDVADETGQSWVTVMDYILQRFETKTTDGELVYGEETPAR